LTNGVVVWNLIAIGLLFAIGALAVAILWPYYDLAFRFDVNALLGRYIDTSQPVTTSEMHRSMALQITRDWAHNGRIVRRLRQALQLALVLLLLQILAWYLSIAGVPL
jgi:hypothetical protein